jgi:hypothetical protein
VAIGPLGESAASVPVPPRGNLRAERAPRRPSSTKELETGNGDPWQANGFRGDRAEAEEPNAAPTMRNAAARGDPRSHPGARATASTGSCGLPWWLHRLTVEGARDDRKLGQPPQDEAVAVAPLQVLHRNRELKPREAAKQ